MEPTYFYIIAPLIFFVLSRFAWVTYAGRQGWSPTIKFGGGFLVASIALALVVAMVFAVPLIRDLLILTALTAQHFLIATAVFVGSFIGARKGNMPWLVSLGVAIIFALLAGALVKFLFG